MSSPRILAAARAAALAGALLPALGGCSSQPTGADGVLDPSQARADMGTLVDISDVLEISQKMVDSLRRSPNLDELLSAEEYEDEKVNGPAHGA